LIIGLRESLVSSGAAGAVESSWADSLEVVFVDCDGARRRESLSLCRDVPFERVRPVRGFASVPGQGNFPGLWWFGRAGDHVGYESWVERDWVMVLDADPEVVAVAAQPFWLSWQAEGRMVRHAPDFFARRDGGSAVVIDVRPDDRIEPQDAAKFEVTARACGLAGWEYRRVGAVPPLLAANLRWLAGYRHPRYLLQARADRLVRVFTTPVALMDGVRAAGDPIAFLPVLFHLLWHRVLAVDLSASLLGPGSVVGPAGERR
jgi:hypothetical protein